MPCSKTQIIQGDFYKHLHCVVHFTCTLPSLGTVEHISLSKLFTCNKQNDNHIQTEVHSVQIHRCTIICNVGKYTKTHKYKGDKQGEWIMSDYSTPCFKLMLHLELAAKNMCATVSHQGQIYLLLILRVCTQT